MLSCPGQDSRFWKPEDMAEIECGKCGNLLEFFKTEGTRRCKNCGTVVVNPKVSLGCAQWCKYAKECLGYDPKEQVDASGRMSLADQLIDAMKREFGSDQPRISHALKVLGYAEDIMRKEKANPKVVLAAAVLHDIGIQQAERAHGSCEAKYQELEGPPIAKRIMTLIGLDEDTIEHVCRIVGSHHSAGDIDTPEFRIVWDADWLVNLQDDTDCTPEKRWEIAATVFKTAAGNEIGEKLFCIDDNLVGD